MANMIEYLDKLDEERVKLVLYRRRFRKLRWLVPGLVKHLFKELDEDWVEVSGERERVLEVIWADPALRKRMLDREKAAGEESRQRLMKSESVPSLPGRPYVVSEGVKEVGKRVVMWEREEAKRLHELDEIQFYYTSGAWQNDGIDVHKLGTLLDNANLAFKSASAERYRKLDGFELRLRMEATNKTEPVSQIREKVLKVIRAEMPQEEKEKDTPLSRFLHEEWETQARVRGMSKDRKKGPTR